MEVGDTSWDHSRRGAPRMAVAAVTNWSAADDLAFSSHTAVWSPAERQRFAARDGFSAVAACSINTTVSTSFNPDEALDVSKDVVLALFGRYQTAVLRMSGMPVQKDSEKEWKRQCGSSPSSTIATTISLRLLSRSMTWSNGLGCLRAGQLQRLATCRWTRNIFTSCPRLPLSWCRSRTSTGVCRVLAARRSRTLSVTIL
jgi:hypothetical protein